MTVSKQLWLVALEIMACARGQNTVEYILLVASLYDFYTCQVRMQTCAQSMLKSGSNYERLVLWIRHEIEDVSLVARRTTHATYEERGATKTTSRKII